MENKKNLKIALLGTSPIMILLYLRICNLGKVDIYEKSSIGGAWAIKNNKDFHFAMHNNVIVPLNSKEEKYIKQINLELKKYNCSFSKPSGLYEINSKYKPKNIFIHDLNNLFKYFSEKANGNLKGKINTVELKNNFIFLNKKKYDLVYFPSCFDLKKITINDKIFKLNPKLSISKHLTILIKDIDIPKISYSENFDNVFDRGYFRNYNNYTIFTGRIRRDFKSLSKSKIINKSNIISKMKKGIFDIKLNKFNHFINDDHNLDILKERIRNFNLKIVETRQFTKSFILLSQYT
jgi:hypothetical protein